MIIQHNISALNSYNKLANNNSSVSKNLSKLSSGYRINSAADDAAGLAISEKMRSQITGLDRAKLNAQDGISLVQTAEGALTEVHSMLNRLVELGTESANGTFQADDRQKIQDEVNALTEEIDRIAESTNFNGINLLDGSLGGGAVSKTGTTLSGATVADFYEAKSSGTAVTEFKAADHVASKETYDVDGQTLTIDWTQGDAKKVYDTLMGVKPTSQEVADEVAQKLQDLFNDEMKKQGLGGSVTITADATGKFSIKSDGEGPNASVGYVGSDVAPASAAKTIGTVLFSKTAGQGEVIAAEKKFANTITAADSFYMDINGTKVEVTGIAASRGEAMDSVAGKLETAIQDAVDAYNTAIGTAGDQLQKGDFTVSVDKDGGFNIVYSGKKDVSFSFSESNVTGNPGKTASLLGLASASSVSSSVGKGLTLQVGDTADDFNKVTVRIDNMSSLGLGINNLRVTDQGLSADSIEKVNKAIEKVSVNRGRLGALQNRLEHTINNLSTTSENMTSAESRIRDTDMAKEMMNFTKNNVLVQAAQSMLAQANQQPQQVLQLLR